MIIWTFFNSLAIMSVPTQKTIGMAWTETAKSSFQTPASVSSRPEEQDQSLDSSSSVSPIAIPSKRLWIDRARTAKKLRSEIRVFFSFRFL